MGGIGDVARLGVHPRSGRKGGDRRAEHARVPAVHDQLVDGAGEAGRERLAEPPRRAGDERDATVGGVHQQIPGSDRRALAPGPAAAEAGGALGVRHACLITLVMASGPRVTPRYTRDTDFASWLRSSSTIRGPAVGVCSAWYP